MKHLLLKLTLLALLTALCAFFVLGCDDTTADPKNSSTNSATDSNDSTASSQPSLNGSGGTIASSTPNGTGSVGGGANDPNPGPSGGDGSGDNGSNGGEGDNGEATCSVIFEENGGSPVEDIKGVAKGDTIVLPEDPKKTGYSFGGWYFDDKSFENKFDESQPITETITLYAKWTDTTRCPSCGEGGVIHDFCEFCQTRVCVGEHDTCTTTASALTTFEAGLYYLCGIYKQHSFVPGVSSATVYFEWQLILNLRDDGTFIFQYSQRANSKHPYYVLINYYGTHTFGEKLTLTLDRAFTCSDLNGTDGDPFPVAKGTTAEVTLYDDNTFSGNLNDLRGICNSCGNYLSTGKHGVCNVCFLAICDGGDHSHGASVCKQCGQSTAVGEHDTCTHCEGYLCDGQSHSLYLPCQEHFQCEGGNHMICFTCGAYKCNGKLHEKCPGCNQMGCVTTEGRHEECEYEGCDGYLCDGQDHFHDGFNCFDHIPSEDDGDCTTPIPCSLCGRETIEGKTHYASTRSYDESYHWGVCENPGCTQTFGKDSHSATGEKCLSDLKCDSCDHITPRVDHSYSSSVCVYCGSNAVTTSRVDGKYVYSLKPEHTYKGWVYINGKIVQLDASEITELYLGPAAQIDCVFNTPNLQNIYVDSSNPNLKSIDGILYDSSNYILQIPAGREGIFTVPDEAVGFRGISYVGDKLTGINAPSQERWESLEFTMSGADLYGTPNPLSRVHNLYFDNKLVTHIKITGRYVRSYGYAGCTATFEFCEGLEAINMGAFMGCTGITSFKAPSTLKAINFYAFEGCENLLEADLSGSTNILTIYSCSFRYCTKLESVNLPSSLLSMGIEVFSGTAIKELVIPEGVISMFESLSGMDSLEYLEVPLNCFASQKDTNYLQYMASFGGIFGRGQSELGSIVQHYNYIHNGVTTLEQLTYKIPLSLKRVKLTGDCDTIPKLMFENCTYIEELIIPASVTTIEGNAFQGISSRVFFESSTLPSGYKQAKYYYTYQETCPTDESTKGKTWRYVNGIPTPWNE